ncbi:unnamed protein product [Miscanthus lutarioriparius]|uniref:Late embryogenesis abundant protein LEA-2 subgroup domain-containing protein n=1 Tax=Miscanthus lutarioriparius TaxID=422564 RepID=A0A811RQL8_9POAL|nr:unnamed protein product [Miscanthus lutarioriparius]
MCKEKHHRDWILHRCCGAIAACILTLFAVVGFIVLVIYLALHPSKPSFYLQDVQIWSIDPALSLDIQDELTHGTCRAAGRHHDDDAGDDRVAEPERPCGRVLQDAGRVHDEPVPVPVPVSMPSIYQGHKDVSVWSPVMSGDAVPVAQYVADAMKQDIAAGYVLLHVKVEGRVKWKVGSWVSGGYHLFVACLALQRRAFMLFYQPLTPLLA